MNLFVTLAQIALTCAVMFLWFFGIIAALLGRERGTTLPHGAHMTQAQAENLHTKWKQQGEPLCEHPNQEWVRLARSDDGVLMGTYKCRECGDAIIYIDRSPPFSTGDRTPNSFLQIFARRMHLVKTSLAKAQEVQGEEKHHNDRPAPVAERP